MRRMEARWLQRFNDCRPLFFCVCLLALLIRRYLLPYLPTRLAPETFLPENETARTLAAKYLGLGEVVFDYVTAASHTSSVFVRQDGQQQARKNS
jgi:hypothetical protein